MPPQYRQCQLALQYVIKLKSNRQNPAYDDIFHGEDPLIDYISDDELSEEEEPESRKKKSKEESLKEREQRREMRKTLPPTFCGRLQEDAVMSDIPLLISYIIKNFLKSSHALYKDLWLITD